MPLSCTFLCQDGHLLKIEIFGHLLKIETFYNFPNSISLLSTHVKFFKLLSRVPVSHAHQSKSGTCQEMKWCIKNMPDPSLPLWVQVLGFGLWAVSVISDLAGFYAPQCSPTSILTNEQGKSFQNYHVDMSRHLLNSITKWCHIRDLVQLS